MARIGPRKQSHLPVDLPDLWMDRDQSDRGALSRFPLITDGNTGLKLDVIVFPFLSSSSRSSRSLSPLVISSVYGVLVNSSNSQPSPSLEATSSRSASAGWHTLSPARRTCSCECVRSALPRFLGRTLIIREIATTATALHTAVSRLYRPVSSSPSPNSSRSTKSSCSER
jgi:hypothetical protein